MTKRDMPVPNSALRKESPLTNSLAAPPSIQPRKARLNPASKASRVPRPSRATPTSGARRTISRRRMNTAITAIWRVRRGILCANSGSPRRMIWRISAMCWEKARVGCRVSFLLFLVLACPFGFFGLSVARGILGDEDAFY